ncbi:hypothetical protein ACET3Z_006092 [Daucus carota]
MRIWIKEKIIHKSYLQPHVDDIDLLVKYPPLDDRALNSRAREIDGMRLKKMTEEIIYFFESFCGKVLRLRVFENRHYPTCAAFMEFATIVISVSQPPADGVYSSASSPSIQGSLK